MLDPAAWMGRRVNRDQVELLGAALQVAAAVIDHTCASAIAEARSVAVKVANSFGTLGTSSTAVVFDLPAQQRAECGSHAEADIECVMRRPIKKSSGRCAIILVIGVRVVMPYPLTRSCLSMRCRWR